MKSRASISLEGEREIPFIFYKFLCTSSLWDKNNFFPGWSDVSWDTTKVQLGLRKHGIWWKRLSKYQCSQQPFLHRKVKMLRERRECIWLTVSLKARKLMCLPVHPRAFPLGCAIGGNMSLRPCVATRLCYVKREQPLWRINLSLCFYYSLFYCSSSSGQIF